MGSASSTQQQTKLKVELFPDDKYIQAKNKQDVAESTKLLRYSPPNKKVVRDILEYSSNEEQVKLILQEDGLECLLEILETKTDPTDKIKENALKTIYNLAAYQDAQDTIEKSPSAIKILIQVFRVNDPKVRIPAASVLSRLAQKNPYIRGKIIEEDGLDSLFKLLKSSEIEERCAAAKTLCNISLNQNCVEDMADLELVTYAAKLVKQENNDENSEEENYLLIQLLMNLAATTEKDIAKLIANTNIVSFLMKDFDKFSNRIKKGKSLSLEIIHSLI